MAAAIDSIKSITGKEIEVFGANYDNSQIDQEGFLKVLLTSFQYQDPFEAQDISKFIDNTVKLRELEVMKNFEDSVKMLSSNDALFLNTTNLIDKSVMYEGSYTYVQNGKTEVAFTPKENAAQATLYLYDDNGNIVKEKSYSDLKAGTSYTFLLDDEEIKDGYYKVSVVAKNGEEKVDTTVKSTAYVTGVQKDGGKIVLLYEKGQIALSDVEKIGG